MFRQYGVSFLFGSLYKLTSDIYTADGIRENIPITITEAMSALGYTFLAYLSANNSNLPITLTAGYILYKNFLKNTDKPAKDAPPADDEKIVSEIIELVKDKTYDILQKITDEDTSYPSNVIKYIEHYGQSKINSIEIRKKPVLGFYKKLLHILTLGDINIVNKVLNAEDFNHTSAIIGILYNDKQRYIMLEKQNKIIISEQYTTDPSLVYKTVEIPPSKEVLLKDFMENGRNAMGKDLNTYHIFKNNCQHFLEKILDANGLITEEIADFINQKAERVNDTMNLFANSVIVELSNITFVMLLVLAALNFSYTQFNPLSIVLNVAFFGLLIKLYQHFFSEKTSIMKICGSIVLLLVLIATFMINLIFNSKYLQNELLLFSIAYVLVSIGSMITQISKEVFVDVINKNFGPDTL